MKNSQQNDFDPTKAEKLRRGLSDDGTKGGE